MSDERDKYGEIPLDLLGLRRNFFVQMFFPDGYTTKRMALCEQIILSCDDPILNMAATILGGSTKGIMILFGLGKIAAFHYEDKKLREMK